MGSIMTMRTGRLARFAILAALVVGVLAVPAQAASDGSRSFAQGDHAGPAERAGRITTARAALERARSLFRVDAARGDGIVPGQRDASLVLRDLLANVEALPAEERAEAIRILARPDDGSGFGADYSVPAAQVRVSCTVHFCVHWVGSTIDAPSLVDANGDTIPDYIESVRTTLEEVWAAEVDGLGYRAPKSDLGSVNHGPDAKVDVYVADIGSRRLYGYCTSDDPAAFAEQLPISAYCVLDDDYSAEQFAEGGTIGVPALQVTAAHEFFHAVQASYDFFEDDILMEGTATWIEDEVYDAVDDNRQFLAGSQLTRPDVPFDRIRGGDDDQPSGFAYGAWILFRYLSEQHSPELVRRTWEFADGTSGAPDQYSLQAVDSALREQGTTFRAGYGGFGLANATVATSYEEGEAYPTPPLARSHRLRQGATASGTAVLDHLTSWYGRFRPGKLVTASAHLRLKLDLPPLRRGTHAALLVVRRDGSVRTVVPQLNANGKATVTVGFGRGRIDSVRLVLTNASDAYTCNVGSPLACGGAPADDDLLFIYSARVQ